MSGFIPRHLSVSSVELYARCPAQWRRRYIDKVDRQTIPMAWGSAFHKALEVGHSGESAEAAWMHAWNDARDKAVAQGETFAPSKSHGFLLLDEFDRRGLAVKCPAEVKFFLPFPSGKIVNPMTRKPIPLLGYIDAVAPDETREYKTSGGRWWTEAKAQIAHQTHVYGWARQRVHRDRRPMRYVIFNTRIPTLTEYLVEPSPDGFRLFEQLAEMVLDGIVNERFEGCGVCELCAPPTEKPANGPTFSWED